MKEFINVLIEDKIKYINTNFKIVFESIRQPNIDEIIKIYKDQEPIDEYKKYVVYVKDFVKTLEDNTVKKITFLMNSKKLWTTQLTMFMKVIIQLLTTNS